MTKGSIVKYKLDPEKLKGLSEETIKRIEAMSDEEIEAAIAVDPDVSQASVVVGNGYRFDPNELNFYRDWIEHLTEHLCKLGYELDEEDPLSIAVRYFNARNRRISRVPRDVEVSHELQSNDLFHGKYKDAIESIFASVRSGGDLTPFLSRMLTDVDFNDYMLNAWNVHHFHLGEETEDDGFVKRTPELLFGMVLEDAILFINIFQHKQWSHRSIIDILESNWPQLMNHFQVDLGNGDAENVSDEQRFQMWKGHLNTFVKSSAGIWYAPMSGGLTTTGSVGEHTRLHDICVDILDQWQTTTVDRISRFAAEAENAGRPFRGEISIRLEFDENDVACAVEQHTRVHARLGNLEDVIESI